MTDYAVVILSRMAQTPERQLTTVQLAQETGVPEPTVAKLMKQLGHDGIVLSQRGAHGGYRLGQAPERITVADILTAIDGPIALTACVDGAAGGCAVEHLCQIRGNWDRVNEAIREALAGVSLTDMGHQGALAGPVA